MAERVDTLVDARVKELARQNQGLLGSLGTPIGFSILGLLTLLSLGASVACIIFFLRLNKLGKRLNKLGKDFEDFKKVAPKAAAAVNAPAPKPQPPAPASAAIDHVSQQLRQQKESIAHLTEQIDKLEKRVASDEKPTTDSLRAVVVQLTRWLEHIHMHGNEADGFDDETEQAAALAALERTSERLRVNASLVEPLTQAIANLVERLESRPSVSSELLGRVQRLYHDIGQFDQWAVTAGAQLGALRRGSIDERRVKFQSEQKELGAQFQAGQINFAQYVEQFRKTVEHHFPAGAGNGRSSEQAAPTLSEEQLSQYVEDAPEYLMDWFSNFSQLQSQAQAAQATGAGVDGEIIDALSQVQSVGREVLNRFDIQQEEIYVGRTSYDRHLHDAAMVRQTTQFPANTVIEVHRAGFRRVSTGEVLRRPQVVVAGSGA